MAAGGWCGHRAVRALRAAGGSRWGRRAAPVNELVEALQMNPTDFREQYNQKMPAKSDHVVFSCFAGSRSKQALNFATSLGFSRVQHYPGGFEEWAKRELPEKK